MSAQSDVRQFLNGLLMTDQASLQFLHQAVFPGGSLPQPELVVIELEEHVREHQDQVPPNLMRWLRAPSSISASVLARLIRFGGFYRDPTIAEPLVGILRQLTFVATHPSAVRALSMSKGSGAARVLTDLLWSAPTHQWHVREPVILRELGRLGDQGVLSHLIEALKVDYTTPRRAAAEAIANFGEDALPNLLPLVQSYANPNQTAGAAEALGLVGDARAVPALQHAVQTDDPTIAIHAAVALARLGSPDAEMRLQELASHNETFVRAMSMSALAITGQQQHEEGPSPVTFRALIRGLEDSMPEVRKAAAIALGGLQHKSAVSSICAALTREVNTLVQVSMLRALGLLAHASALPLCLEKLKDNNSSTNIKIEALDALSQFTDPTIAGHIVPFRSDSNPKLVQAANRALRRLLHKPFAWPTSAALESPEPIAIDLFHLVGARERFLPPPPPPPKPGFFDRLFGSKAPEVRPGPKPIGKMILSNEGLTLEFNADVAEQQRWPTGAINWSKRFTVQITREPIAASGSLNEGPDDIGIHFMLRQREGDIGANFQTVAVSLWCARSEIVGQFPAKSSQLPCIDPHASMPFLAALLWYTELHGNPIRSSKIR